MYSEVNSENYELSYEAHCSLELDELFTYFANPLVDEILLNGFEHVVLVQGGTYQNCDRIFASKDAMIDWLYHFSVFADVRLDPLQPFAGGSLDDGAYRWHCVLPPVAAEGPLFSLRRNRFDRLSLEHFQWGVHCRRFFERAILSHLPVLVVGPTGSGKTSLLVTALRQLGDVQERAVFLETIAEIPMLQPGWIRLVEKGRSYSNQGAIGIDALLRESLRLRPDRYVIGEIRSGGEAGAFMQACLTGHGGALATIHGNNIGQALFRLSHLLSKSRPVERSICGIKRNLHQMLGDLCVVQLARGQPPLVEAVEFLSGD